MSLRAFLERINYRIGQGRHNLSVGSTTPPVGVGTQDKDAKEEVS